MQGIPAIARQGSYATSSERREDLEQTASESEGRAMRREKVILLSIGRPDVHHPLFRGEGRATEAKKGVLDFSSKYRGRPPEVAGSNPTSPSLGFL
jgi:hypothetical protein